MIVRDGLRLGNSVEAAGRVLTPILRVRYTIGSESRPPGLSERSSRSGSCSRRTTRPTSSPSIC